MVKRVLRRWLQLQLVIVITIATLYVANRNGVAAFRDPESIETFVGWSIATLLGTLIIAGAETLSASER